MYENQYLSTVLAPQDFVLLCTSVQCGPPRASYSVAGARPVGLCTSAYFSAVRVPTAFVWCEPTKALCFGVLYELQELCAVRAYKVFLQCAPELVLLYTVRTPRSLRGASLQRLCASVCCTSPTSFFRCEPTKTLYSVRQDLCFCVLYEPHELCAVRAYKGFVQCVLYEPHELCAARAYKSFRQCALYEPHDLCAVRAYNGFIQRAGVRPPSFAPSAYVPVRSYEQMSSCTRTCTYALVHMYCTSSHVNCGSVREPIYLYVAERNIHVELVRLRVFCEHPQSRSIYCNRYCS